jgi:hypothetical protein
VARAGARAPPGLAGRPARGVPRAAGAAAELARAVVYAGRPEALPDLEDTLVALNLAVLAGRAWPPGVR